MEAAQKTDYTSGESSIDTMESYMLQFEGGEISISNQYWNEGIAIIQINNPKKRNAISGKMMAEFRSCITKLESWKEGKAVILYGFGDNFCSGADLDMARHKADGYYFSYFMQHILKRLRNLPLISIALAHGPTLGGGSEIAVSCDFILVSQNVKLGFVQGKMGIITAWGGTTRLIQAIGEKKALELVLSSRILGAEECVEIGLASKILENDNKLEQCLEWTRIHTQHHYTVTRAFKEAAMMGSRKYDEHIDIERDLFIPLWGGPANQEALSKNIKHVKIKKENLLELDKINK